MEKVLASFPFLGGSNWEGTVEVVERSFQDVRHINLRLRVKGQPTVLLPRQDHDEICKALTAANAEASKQYRALLVELNDKERKPP